MGLFDLLNGAITLLIGGGVAILSAALTDRRAAQREQAQREHETQVRGQERDDRRADRSEQVARERITDLLHEYQERYTARITYRETGEDGRHDWLERTSADAVAALLIPQREARESILSVVNYIGEMSNSYHGRAILGPHDSYGSAIFEAVMLGRDACAQWLRDGTIEPDTRVAILDLDLRYSAWLLDNGGPEPAGP